jgi:hypothetical protein
MNKIQNAGEQANELDDELSEVLGQFERALATPFHAPAGP